MRCWQKQNLQESHPLTVQTGAGCYAPTHRQVAWAMSLLVVHKHVTVYSDKVQV